MTKITRRQLLLGSAALTTTALLPLKLYPEWAPLNAHPAIFQTTPLATHNIFHVLLNGVGASGNGSTWADDSNTTSAFIGQAGFGNAVAAAADGDVIYVKG